MADAAMPIAYADADDTGATPAAIHVHATFRRRYALRYWCWCRLRYAWYWYADVLRWAMMMRAQSYVLRVCHDAGVFKRCRLHARHASAMLAPQMLPLRRPAFALVYCCFRHRQLWRQRRLALSQLPSSARRSMRDAEPAAAARLLLIRARRAANSWLLRHWGAIAMMMPRAIKMKIEAVTRCWYVGALARVDRRLIYASATLMPLRRCWSPLCCLYVDVTPLQQRLRDYADAARRALYAMITRCAR